MSRMSQLRQALIWFGLGGIVMVSWVLISYGLFLLILMRVICLFVSIGLLAGLVWLTVVTTKILVSKSMKLRDENRKQFIHWPMFILFVCVLLILFVVAAVITDWWIGASIRSASGSLSFLPHGNLLIAGGRMGWTYVILVALILAGMLLKKRTSSGSSSLPRSPRKRRIGRPDRTQAKVDEARLSQDDRDEAMQRLFTPNG